jgi:DNA-binding LacI/PurR family transcriptional regulator
MHEPTDRSAPYYQQVATVLRTRIVSSNSTQSVRLPTEEELCRVHGVSRITVRRAMKILQEEGLVQRTPRRGTVTLPKGVSLWKRRRQNLPIYVVTTWERLPLSTDVPVTFYGQLYQGICQRCEREGYWISTRQLQGPSIEAKRQAGPPNRKSALGVIIIGAISEPLLRRYTNAGYPVVCVDYWSPNTRANTVALDCFTEGQTAVEFLLKKGHADFFYLGNILTVRQQQQREPDAELLLAGIQRAMVLAGLPPLPPDRIAFCRTLAETVEPMVDWFLHMRPRPTAGIIFQHRMLELFVQGLAARGLRPPNDVSLLSKALKGTQGALTCLLADARVMGEAAVDILLRHALGRASYTERIMLPTQLWRGSTVSQRRTHRSS